MKHRVLNPVIARVGDKEIREGHRDEINRAINNVRRTAEDKLFRKEWYRAAAKRARRW